MRANELEAENEKLRQLSAAESRRANALDAANKELREQVVSLSRALEQAVATGQRNGHGLPEFNAAPQSCESCLASRRIGKKVRKMKEKT